MSDEADLRLCVRARPVYSTPVRSNGIAMFASLRTPLVAALLILSTLAPGQAQTRVAPESRADVQLSFAPVVRRTAPAVVNVYASRTERRDRNDSMEDFFRRFFGEGGPGMPPGRSQTSLGSGVIVDSSGLVITNNHVIENMNEVKVALADRREFEAQIVLRDQRTDLAVLKLNNVSDLHVLELGDSERLEVGDIVLAIGNPFGVGQTVTQGIVSALARTQVGVTDYQFFIQTDAAINPGNSGGALVDMAGRLVGVNTAIFSRSGGSQGVGFAIPATMVRLVVSSARSGGSTVKRPWLGAKLQALTPELSQAFNLQRPSGVVITSVTDKGPAEEAGLRRNDVIVELDGQSVDDPDAFGYRFALKGLGGETGLTVMRGAKRTTVQVKLQTPPETRPREPVKVRSRSPLAGVTAVNLSPAVADELQLEVSADGVVIAEVDE